MAITADTDVDYENLTSQSSYTFSATVNSGSNIILIVGVSAFNQVSPGNSVVTGVTFNGDAMTKADDLFVTDSATFDLSQSIWYLVNPDVATGNVVVSQTGAITGFHAYAASYFGVKQTSPVDDTAKQDSLGIGAGTTHSTSITSSESGVLVVDTFVTGGAAATADGSQTTIMTFASNADRGSYKIAGAAGTQTMTWTTGVNDIGIQLVAGFLPAAAAGSSIKSVLGLAKASVKSVDSLAIASVKSINGLT